jgi:hypothetical protein
MHYNFQYQTWITNNSNFSNFGNGRSMFNHNLFFLKTLESLLRWIRQCLLSSWIISMLLFFSILVISHRSYGLTSITSNFIYGNAPYLTFDGGRTRVTNTDGLLGITLSNGTSLTPANNISSAANPIELPYGDSFADIDMFVPTNLDSVELNLLIRAPYNYWGDDDGDGQGTNGILADGHLTLSIVDNDDQAVARSASLDICKSPYKLTLTNVPGSLSTMYGFPKTTEFNRGSVIYYINPGNVSPKVCYAQPNKEYGSLKHGYIDFRGPVSMWNEYKGFIPQSTNSSGYGLNFPTTGADHLYFYLIIGGSGRLNWAPVTLSGITASMEPDSSGSSVKVLLTGPVATEAQWVSNKPDEIKQISRPELPQTFELVGKDDTGNVVVKYGFTIKQWFLNRGNVYSDFNSSELWCGKLNYHLVQVKDLTNATCNGASSGSHCIGAEGAAVTTHPSPNNYYQRVIDAGFLAEWGDVEFYGSNSSMSGSAANFSGSYWTRDEADSINNFVIDSPHGSVFRWDKTSIDRDHTLCVSHPRSSR